MGPSPVRRRWVLAEKVQVEVAPVPRARESSVSAAGSPAPPPRCSCVRCVVATATKPLSPVDVSAHANSDWCRNRPIHPIPAGIGSFGPVLRSRRGREPASICASGSSPIAAPRRRAAAAPRRGRPRVQSVGSRRCRPSRSVRRSRAHGGGRRERSTTVPRIEPARRGRRPGHFGAPRARAATTGGPRGRAQP